jgi:hypothetical protein
MLADARFGAIAYPTGYIAKSGVFAAYCAHGICPILIADAARETDGLIPGRHYCLGVPDRIVPEAHSANIAENAWDWYQSHSVTAHVRALEGLMVDVRARMASHPPGGISDDR